ncbi:hypothetical protein PS710_03200 [Pseudomonas fluorescens]|uniref:GTP cyclohydrolase I n=1 Tax=Pseudomonas fluorescens TaxID=294 RepID=A0A5E7CS75_PSEFL|nr:hypothetical protein PS710_03200 [Pseudomonas fluorescens]
MHGIALPLSFDGQLLSAKADAGVSLVSPLSGWKSYPVSIEARLKNAMFHVELKIDVTYSSTCPCSAALSSQLIQQQFVDDFVELGRRMTGKKPFFRYR